MPEHYINKVEVLAKFKYDLESEVLSSFYDDIDKCWNAGFTPRRAVEYIAKIILGLK